jgi:hypothetical protein
MGRRFRRMHAARDCYCVRLRLDRWMMSADARLVFGGVSVESRAIAEGGMPEMLAASIYRTWREPNWRGGPGRRRTREY